MGLVTLATDPLAPGVWSLREEAAGLTVREWLERAFPGFEEFESPTICVFNGQLLMRSQWAEVLIGESDVVTFATIPGEASFWAAVIEFVVTYWVEITLVISVGYSLSMSSGMPDIKGIPEPDSVHSLQGQRNKLRLGHPVPSYYGRNHVWPDYAMPPYTRYYDNAQWLYQLFCIGQGEYEVHGIYIEDTPIDNFEEVTYQVVAPGDSFNMFTNEVETSSEVGGIELFAPNEAEYLGDSGPFVANAAFSDTYAIEIDISFPNGLYSANDDGSLGTRAVSLTFEKREIDDSGVAVGIWSTLTSFSKTLKTTTPQRFTVYSSVSSGRYEVRARRDTSKTTGDSAHKTRDRAIWEGMRSMIGTARTYPGKTVLGVRMRATNNLNDRSQNRINVDCTRKLPAYDAGTETWSVNASTRSAVWALCDTWRANYGGQAADEKLALADLAALDAELEADGLYLDFGFDSKSTVWEASEIIAAAVMCSVIRRGSKVTMLREQVQSLATGVFSLENIKPDSFRWEKRHKSTDEFDSVEILYLDETTNQEERLLCTDGTDAGEKPRSVKLRGQRNRNWAYRIGMRIRMRDKFIRDSYSFATGFEGLLPDWGDRILVSHDVPRWGQFGLVESFDGTTATLNKELDWSEVGTKQIILRTKAGAQSGPHTVTQGATADIAVLSTPISVDDFILEDTCEPPFFIFGVSGEVGKAMVLRKAKPKSGGVEEVDIEAVPYDTRLFAYDEIDAPALGQVENQLTENPLPVATDLWAIEYAFDKRQVYVSWSAADGAKFYILEQSTDGGVNWERVVRTPDTYYILATTGSHLHLRVAAYNIDRGPYATWDGEVGGVNPGGASFLDATPLVSGAYVTWVITADYDRMRSLVYISTVNTLPDAASWSYAVDADSLTINELIPGTTYYIWVREQDDAKNISDDVVGPVTVVPASSSTSAALSASANGYIFAANSSGTISDSFSLGDTDIELFLGTAEKTYAATATNERWRVTSVTATNVTRNGALTLPTLGITAMSADSGYLLAECVYRDSGGVDADAITVKIPYTKAKSGSDGAPGDDGTDGTNGEDGTGQFTLVGDSDILIVGNTAKKISGGALYNAHAYSLEGFTGGAFCSFQTSNAAVELLAGLNADPTASEDYPGIDHCWFFRGDNGLNIYESGTLVASPDTPLGTYTTSTILSVVYDGASIKYLKDGALMHTTAASAGLKLFFDSSFKTVNGELVSIAFGPAGPRGDDGATAESYSATDTQDPITSDGVWYTLPSITLAAGDWHIALDGFTGGGGPSGPYTATVELRTAATLYKTWTHSSNTWGITINYSEGITLASSTAVYVRVKISTAVSGSGAAECGMLATQIL